MSSDKDKLIKIKNELIKYLLTDVEDNFQNLTRKERAIVGDQKTLDKLISSVNLNKGKS